MKHVPLIRFFMRGCIYALFFIGAMIGGMALYIFHHHVVDFTRLEQYSSGRPSIVLDDMGQEWARFQHDRRDPIMLAAMPEHLINAFISAEDWRFFHHCGISWRGVVRSIWVNCMRGYRAQGASTITQQLVRLLFFDTKKTFVRKIKEQVCALLVEQQFTKEHILQAYLNYIYFGCGMYGVEAASQRFWHKSAIHLEIHESATLAAIICAPNKYCPLLYPLCAQRRRDIILGSMHKLGYITTAEYNAAKAEPLRTISEREKVVAPHLKEALRIQLESIVGKRALYTGGLTIQTTLNLAMQRSAEHAFNTHIRKLRTECAHPFDGGMLAIDTATGAIKAYVGGYDFIDSKFDRVRSAERQIGSTFKVLIYAAAMKAGKKPYDTVVDEPLAVEWAGATWSPRNYTRDFRGEMTLAYALSRSNNIVAVKTLLDVGIDPVIDLAHKCHIAGNILPYPSLALGCIDAPLMSVVGMFNIFANTGLYVEPYKLVWVKDALGNKVWKQPIKQPEPILDSHTVGQVAKILTLGMERLHSLYPNRWPPVDALSKTGTTNDSRTCWFMGSTPTITTGIYVGCDDNRSMGAYMYPIHTAFPIWLEFNNSITHSRSKFIYDSSLQEIIVDERTGNLVDAGHKGAIRIMA